MSVTDATSRVTHYAYDAKNNLTTITNANDNYRAFTPIHTMRSIGLLPQAA